MTAADPNRFEFKLDLKSGVPVYRQIIDQVQAGRASGTLRPGAQLPTVRQVAVDLEINPNTVLRAYRELEIRGVLDTQQGTGTFVAQQPVALDEVEQARKLEQLVNDVIARAGAAGFTLHEVVAMLQERLADASGNRG
ncbi:MAG: GntR family transcriptional regulator [Acidobacteriota bacterium]